MTLWFWEKLFSKNANTVSSLVLFPLTLTLSPGIPGERGIVFEISDDVNMGNIIFWRKPRKKLKNRFSLPASGVKGCDLPFFFEPACPGRLIVTEIDAG